LAAGCGDIFELGRVFRAAESGRRHNPEFTLLEWYRTGTDYHRLMDEVAALVRFCGGEKFSHWKEERLSYRQLFLRHLGIDPLTADAGLLAATAEKHGITDVKLEQRQWLDLLISFVIQPDLPTDRLTFVHDFPAEQAALARIRPGNPPVAERFELYLGQTELANGYQELTDADEQRRRFNAENAERGKRGLPECDIDERLVAALEHGLPECAGVALGVDRLQMALGNHPSIDDVTAFPYSRA
jgi:lysyl-tRNA synthetase class 2